jgi:hypothetical protein
MATTAGARGVLAVGRVPREIAVFHGADFAARTRAPFAGAASAWAAGRPVPNRHSPVAAVTVSVRQQFIKGFSADPR